MKLFTLLFFIPFFSISQNIDPLRTKDDQAQTHWVDSIYKTMSLEQKIGQLFMVQSFSSQSSKQNKPIKELIEKHYIGGIIFSKGTPVAQAKLTNEFQRKSKIPLFIAMDAEWGLAMRLDSVYAFPWNMTLGALKDNGLVEQTGIRIAQHCKRLGVHIDFAPDIDINTNPKNPIIGNRSFGESKFNVAQKGIAFTKGMQSMGVLACVKHFPGHGDTEKDSHKTLPTVSFSKERLETTEFYPFERLIHTGVASLMVGHLNVPALDEGKPASISYKIVSGIIKQQMNFQGIIFSDALGMKGVADYADTAQVDLQAFLAGNDVLLMSSDPLKGIEALKNAYNTGVINEYRLAYSVKKILKAKYWVGLNKYKPIPLTNLTKDLNMKEDELLSEKIYEKAITLVQNNRNILPLKDLATKRTAYIKFGDDSGWEFFKNLRYYQDVVQLKSSSWGALSKEMAPYDRIVIGVHRSNTNPWAEYKLNAQELTLLQKIASQKEVILTFFVKPYALLDIPNVKQIGAIVMAYQNASIAQQKAAQLIYGALPFEGVLPVTVHKDILFGRSLPTRSLKRLGYGLAENAGMNSNKFYKIDSIITEAIQKQMTPSAQILVARRGVVVYNKSFGRCTYDITSDQVTNNTLYDLASLTKILSTLPELIELYDKQKIKLDTTLATLLPILSGTNKANITVKEALSHYGQLQSWLPFYRATIDSKTKVLSNEVYSPTLSSKYPTQVADNLFIKEHYRDTILASIAQSDLIKQKKYLYSDLAYYIFQRYIELQKGKPLNEIIQKDFYGSMGAYQLTYLPLQHFLKSQIAPTEEDKNFRQQLIRGYVHDQGAAMLGGVAGHAGLFGTANDVAKMMQLYLQKGYYGGIRYFSANAFDAFNKTYFISDRNRRALGFDKPQLDGQIGYTCGCVSPESFGHTGFTGTFAWADPRTQTIYVFLSNRTFPTSDNKKLITENIRAKIQQVIQEAIIN